MQHKRVDRPPFDLCATPMSLAGAHMEADLRVLLNISAPIEHKYMNFDEGILRALGIDFRRVGGMPAPESPLISRGKTRAVDCWGIERSLVDGDWQITKNPLNGASLDDLAAFPWPQAASADMRVISKFRDNAKEIYECTDYVVCAEHPALGVMELGCWMCGFDDFLYKMAAEPEFVTAFFDRIYAYQRDMIDLYYGAIGEYIHVTTSGDDFGTQNGPFVSPAMFSELVAPYYDKRIALTKTYTRAHFFHHTCGGVYPLIERMIQSGVDILNPIQPHAKDMDPGKLRVAFGDRLTFWGGIDTQHVLPNCDTNGIKAHVEDVLRTFGDAGGYIFAPAHVIQRDVPAENVIAMYRAAEAFYA